jgi:demethylmenaquinone methyltransferase/2-methoxy-6-polyprenyl-1,4-benzoquinol methylase
MAPGPRDDLDALLIEQIAYYRARAPEYFDGAIDVSPETETAVRRELLAAFASFAPAGDVLELACGPGTWTGDLLACADTVTALDSAPEMLALARATVSDPRATFVQADLFDWTPPRRYDAVFFGFWLSHVPLERLERFWSLVADCLVPEGRVLFIDDAYRTPDELIEGEHSSTIQRRLSDGTPFRAVKVAHTPAELERRLADLGWRIAVTPTSGPFFWGAGQRALSFQ